MKNSMKAGIGAAILAAVGGAFTVGCTSQADIGSQNLSRQAENFEIQRRVVVQDDITHKPTLEITGKCSVEFVSDPKRIELTCKNPNGDLSKHYALVGDNSTTTVEQINGSNVSTDRLEIRFNPTEIVPMVVGR